MKNNKIKKIVLLFLLIFCINTIIQKMSIQPECYGSFEDFVLSDPIDQFNNLVTYHPKWESEFLFEKSKHVTFQSFKIQFSREYNNSLEIWIRRFRRIDEKSVYDFIIYYPELKEYKEIKNNENKISYSSFVFKDDKNNVYLLESVPYQSGKTIDIERGVKIYKYDDNKLVFNKNILINPLNNSQGIKYNLIDIESNGNIWFIVEEINNISSKWPYTDNNIIFGYLYNYDVKTNEMRYIMELKDIYIQDIEIGRDGNIYLLDFLEKYRHNAGEGEGIQKIFKYYPKNDEMIEFAKIPWNKIYVRSILLDSSDRLWVDSVGYYDSKIGEWNLIHHNIDVLSTLFSQGSNFLLHHPVPENLFEDSRGRIWFLEASELAYGNGIGWFNPDTKEGCWVTNYPMLPIEDNDGNYWMVIEDVLYKFNY